MYYYTHSLMYTLRTLRKPCKHTHIEQSQPEDTYIYNRQTLGWMVTRLIYVGREKDGSFIISKMVPFASSKPAQGP